MSLTFEEYADAAAETAIYPEKYGVTYPALGLVGEAGEVAEKIKKILRDYDGEFTPTDKLGILSEVGDVLWYVAALCRDLGLSMEDAATTNLGKLQSRKERGVLGGSGDNR